MANGQSSALGVHAQNHVGPVLNQGPENALIRRLATVVTSARALTLRLQNVIHMDVQVNSKCLCNNWYNE